MIKPDTDLQHTLAYRLRCLRTRKKLRQSDVATAINISSRTYSNYERAYRMPDLRILSSLADFYNVSTDFLLGRTNLIYPYPFDRKTLESLTTDSDTLIKVAESEFNSESLPETLYEDNNDEVNKEESSAD
ncbi:MAG: helix-turn-helix transcriptional regulator [Fastidiosipila sp.]|nr:helix-turn-helix transcriptional regulator [Fastidiosipila sp.]